MNATIYIILTLAAVFGTLCTYFLSHKKNQGPVRSSALLALLVGGFFYFFPNSVSAVYASKIPIYVIGGSFIGMVTTKTNISYLSLILSPILFSILMVYMSRYFTGYGGALGTMACISLMCSMAFPLLTRNKKVTYGYRLLRVQYKRTKKFRRKKNPA